LLTSRVARYGRDDMRWTWVVPAVSVLGVLGVPAAAGAGEPTPEPQFAIAILPPTKPVAAHAMTWTVKAYVTAEHFSLRLARHSGNLRLLHRGSKPAWQYVDGRPQWTFSPLDPSAGTVETVRFRTAVARGVSVGGRVCIGLRAIGINGSGVSENRRSTGVDRRCGKVARR
jgi:hypothetical protein